MVWIQWGSVYNCSTTWFNFRNNNSGTSHCNGELQAEADLMFAFLEEGHLVDGPLFNPGDLRAMLRLMNFFHVAKTADGNPIPYYKNL